MRINKFFLKTERQWYFLFSARGKRNQLYKFSVIVFSSFAILVETLNIFYEPHISLYLLYHPCFILILFLKPTSEKLNTSHFLGRHVRSKLFYLLCWY